MFCLFCVLVKVDYATGARLPFLIKSLRLAWRRPGGIKKQLRGAVMDNIIQAIISELRACNDYSLLDLIYSLLVKEAEATAAAISA